MIRNPAVQLAEAVVADLNEAEWELTFEATRSYRPAFDLEDLDELRVTVTPAAADAVPISRGEYDRHVGVLVALQQQVGPEETDRLDALTDLVHAITTHLEDRRLDGMPTARFEGAESDPLYHPDLLENQRVFLAPILVKYRLNY
ncbi:MAG: hypothetical protein AAGG38_06340 [Planctomycetota bacterium]